MLQESSRGANFGSVGSSGIAARTGFGKIEHVPLKINCGLRPDRNELTGQVLPESPVFALSEDWLR